LKDERLRPRSEGLGAEDCVKVNFRLDFFVKNEETDAPSKNILDETVV
jgi:hypothetical protein